MWIGPVVGVHTVLVAAILGGMLAPALSHCEPTYRAKDWRKTVELRVDPLKTKPFRKFWESTGFSSLLPETAREYLLSDAMKMNLAYIGSLPNRAIKEVRPHWLLELVVNDFKDDKEKSWPKWNYTLLDEFLDSLHGNGLQPIFEFMGNPDGFFTDLTNPFVSDWISLVELVENIVVRYALRYGVDNIKNWRFETWNEPDLSKYNTMNFTLRMQYLFYFSDELDEVIGPPRKSVVSAPSADYTQGYFEWLQRGLHHAALELHKQSVSDTILHFRLGGPAGTFKARDKHPICWGVLRECHDKLIMNQSCGFDFITFHRKGGGTVAGVLNGGIELVQEIVKEFPHLSKLSFANDESDMLTGWWRPEEWRGDARYGALAVSNVIQHHLHWRSNDKLPRLELLSHDNGFLEHCCGDLKFHQRTLLASFENPLFMVRKPVMAGMAIMSYLGDQQIANVSAATEALAVTDNFSFLATLFVERGGWDHGWDIGLLYSIHNETEPSQLTPEDQLQINLHVDNLPPYTLSVERTSLQPKAQILRFRHGGPMEAWEQAGQPEVPDEALRKNMTRLAEIEAIPGLLEFLPDGTWRVRITASMPEAGLVQICVPSDFGPGPVTGLRAMNVSYNEVLLLWRDSEVKTRCLLTYDVQFRPNDAAEWRSLSEELPKGSNIHFLSFHVFGGKDELAGHAEQGQAKPETVRGQYRVRAIDIWRRAGPFTQNLHYPYSPAFWETLQPQNSC